MSNISGLVGWHSTYAHQFGLERWKNELFPALKRPVKHVCLDQNNQSCVISLAQIEEENKQEGYFIDGASLACAVSVSPLPGENVLDMCAAPGGKSVVLARQMQSGSLVCNELSKQRLQRLKQTITDFANIPKLSIKFTNNDSSSTNSDFKRVGPFDRILLDAACSSDRHIMTDSDLMQRWSPASVKAQTERQVRMLSNAASLVKPGGLIVYSTCALSDKENDGAILKFLSKKDGLNFQVSQDTIVKTVLQWIPGAELTPAGGCIVLPDRTNYGPLYICHLRRNNSIVS